MSKKQLLLVDGHALLYRAYHAFPPLTSPSGEPTGAVFGFWRILTTLLKDRQPSHLGVAFDVKDETTFRKEQFPAYKATRSPMPDDLAAQIELAHELVTLLDCPIYAKERWEADDLLGTIAKQAESEGFEVLILSPDRDLWQLATEHIHLIVPGLQGKRELEIAVDDVPAHLGISAGQVVEYKGLRGDPSDNLPGVPGVGEVTAKEILSRFANLEELYEALEAGTAGLKPAVTAKLIAAKEDAYLSRELATIRTDAPATFDAARSRLEVAHPDQLAARFADLGFKSLLRDLPKATALGAQVAAVFEEAGEAPTVQVDAPSYRTDEALAPILREMEHYGVMIDRSYLQGLERTYAEEIADLADELNKAAGQPFNPDSPTQVSHILYEVLGAPTAGVKKTQRGYTTDADALEKLSHIPLAGRLLKYREVTKLLSTYIKPLQEAADAQDRIHTSYAPDTATGRISSRNPNLQNIPVRTERGQAVRRAFIASPGHQLVAADYSQIELRVAADLSADPGLIAAFKEHADFHEATARRMGVDRRTAKVINFSILYGKGAFGLSQDLGISVPEAKQYLETYFATFPKLRAYLDEQVHLATTQGFVETKFGRRRSFPELMGNAPYVRKEAAKREAMNLPIQGTAADIMKLAMVALAPRLTQVPGAHLMLTVHDELVLDVPEVQVATTAKLLQEVMESAVTLSVPVEVEVKLGSNWRDLSPVQPGE